MQVILPLFEWLTSIALVALKKSRHQLTKRAACSFALLKLFSSARDGGFRHTIEIKLSLVLGQRLGSGIRQRRQALETKPSLVLGQRPRTTFLSENLERLE
ncbi:MAG: hypothetical protein O3A00_19860 [Planctomycetota bacterium]|nr:hypothetical protein [Planctomycetota bacterium]